MGEEPASISGLFARLADDAGALIRAEVELYRATALHRLALSRKGLTFIALALVIAVAAICSLLVMLAIGLARWMGPVGAGLVICFLALALAGLLTKLGFDNLSNAAEDNPEAHP